MLAREYCDAAGIKLKPIILSHHMLYGLKVRPQGGPRHTPSPTLPLAPTLPLSLSVTLTNPHRGPHRDPRLR